MEATAQIISVRKTHSILVYCPFCDKSYKRNSALEAHINNCLPKNNRTDKDQIKANCSISLQSISNIQYVSTVTTRSDPHRIDICNCSDDIVEYLVDGSTKLIREQRKHGFGHKMSSNFVATTIKTMEFILFCQGAGDKNVGNRNNMIPSDAAKLMRLLGTSEGEKVLDENQYNKEYVKRNDTNTRHFKCTELLNPMQLKSHMSKERPELEQFSDRLATELLINPLLASITKLSTSKAIIAKIVKVHSNHAIQILITDEMTAKKPKMLRKELYELVVTTYNNDPVDLRLFSLQNNPVI